MESRQVHVPAISCDHCARTIREELLDLEGVAWVEVDVTAKSVRIGWQPPAAWATIAAHLREINYPVAD
jgi:copper chaperone CopZ